MLLGHARLGDKFKGVRTLSPSYTLGLSGLLLPVVLALLDLHEELTMVDGRLLRGADNLGRVRHCAILEHYEIGRLLFDPNIVLIGTLKNLLCRLRCF